MSSDGKVNAVAVFLLAGAVMGCLAMPPRGGKSDLRADEVRDVAAYIWAISQTRGEPWPGGHEQHSPAGPPAVPRTHGP